MAARHSMDAAERAAYGRAMSQRDAQRADVIDVSELHAKIADAVRSVAAVDPAPTDPFRGLYLRDEEAVALAGGTPTADIGVRLDVVARALGLDGVARAVLLAIALPELDARHLRLYGYLHDDLQRRLPSARLLGRLLDHAADAPRVWQALAPSAPLRRCGAVLETTDQQHWPMLDRGLRLSEPVAATLLGLEHPTAAIGAHDIAPDRRVTERVRTALQHAAVVLARGTDAGAVIAAAAGADLVVIQARHLDEEEVRAGQTAAACLRGAPLAVQCGERADEQTCRLVAEHLTGLPVAVVLLADAPLPRGHETLATVEVDVEAPGHQEREAFWRAAGAGDEAAELALAFRLSRSQLQRAARTMPPGERANWRDAARRVSRSGLAELATPVSTELRLEELVLADRPRRLLAQVALNLRHRERVLEDWGMRRVTAAAGMKLLFAGESGTGKTLAAAALARELGLDAFRIDLATVVSKYIGETEKNLERVFTAAGGSNAVLFFDEADAIFGKRSEVSSSHDRYANLEVAYLLQRMEQHDGAVILATNLRRNIDEAFLRRLDIVVDFPMPEPAERAALWRLHLPDAVPLADDVDLETLARAFKLSGGNIRNCALAACVQAVADDSPVRARHLEDAVGDEYSKLGRLIPPGAPLRDSRGVAA